MTKDQFLAGYYGKNLLERHSLDEIGVWKIVSEGDEQGANRKTLAHVNGQLTDVIDLALKTPGFFSWGSGGSLEKITVLTTFEYTKVLEGLDIANELEAQAQELKKKFYG